MGFKEIKDNNIKDVKSANLWKSVVAELLGTMFLVFFGCGTATNQQKTYLTFTGIGNVPDGSQVPLPANYVHISFSFGLVVGTIVWSIAHVSGGHINPAVTIGLLIARKITFVRAVLYIVAQCAGAIAGSGILYGVTPSAGSDALGVNGLQGNVDVGQGIGVEFMITFTLVLTVLASIDENRTDIKGSAPLTIGLAVVLGHLLAIGYTGCSMNPARSFGPAVIKNVWTDHWVYWVGPISGSIVAAPIYMFLFSAPKPTKVASESDGHKDVKNGSAMEITSFN